MQSTIEVLPPATGKGSDGYASDSYWYVVEAYEHSVEQAYLRLAVAGLRVWMPVDLKRQANRSRSTKPRRDIRIPRFGRYFFVHCRMTEALQHAIDHTPSVEGLLLAAQSDRPAPLPAHVVEWLRKPPEKAADVAQPYVVGDTIRIVDGPFVGFEAKVEDVDKRGAIRLIVDILGRPTPLVLEVGHVEMALPAKSRAISSLNRPGVAKRRSAKHFQTAM